MSIINQIDKIRRFLRNVLPMKCYRKLAFVYDCFAILKTREYDIFRAYFRNPQLPVYGVYSRKLGRKISVRGNSPDLSCIIQNIVREEYGFSRNSRNTEYIVDAGGYIGDTALYFNKLFPKARILVLEPESENYSLCNQNIHGIDKIELMNAGLGAKDGFLDVKGAFWSAKAVKLTERDPPSSLRLIPLDQLMARCNLNKIDILKMDIEGGETDVLNDRNAIWPSKTQMILVETHGPASEQAVANFASHYAFEVLNFRSIKILRRKGFQVS